MNTFFKELKVIELSSVLAGPAVGMFFAELGAEVIKIENPKTGGDITRAWKLSSEDKDAAHSAYYCSVNWGKKNLFLDLEIPSDYAQLLALLPDADVVISNFKPNAAQKMKLNYATFRKIKPNLIFAQLTAYGEDDPRVGFDVVLQAETGFLYMTGEPNGKPVKMPVALIDLMAAHQLKEGILLALLHRARTGEGSYVSTTLYEAAIASLANQASNWLMAQHIPQKMGTQHPNIAPYGDIFYTSDQKPIIVAIGTDNQFQQLCNVLQIPYLATEENFVSNAARVKNRIALAQILDMGFAQFEYNFLLDRLQQKGIPAGGVYNMPEVFEASMAQAMILEDEITSDIKGRRVKTIAFNLQTNKS